MGTRTTSVVRSSRIKRAPSCRFPLALLHSPPTRLARSSALIPAPARSRHIDSLDEEPGNPRLLGREQLVLHRGKAGKQDSDLALGDLVLALLLHRRPGPRNQLGCAPGPTPGSEGGGPRDPPPRSKVSTMTMPAQAWALAAMIDQRRGSAGCVDVDRSGSGARSAPGRGRCSPCTARGRPASASNAISVARTRSSTAVNREQRVEGIGGREVNGIHPVWAGERGAGVRPADATPGTVPLIRYKSESVAIRNFKNLILVGAQGLEPRTR